MSVIINRGDISSALNNNTPMVYRPKNTHYKLEFLTLARDESGSWSDGVCYSSESGVMYTRKISQLNEFYIFSLIDDTINKEDSEHTVRPLCSCGRNCKPNGFTVKGMRRYYKHCSTCQKARVKQGKVNHNNKAALSIHLKKFKENSCRICHFNTFVYFIVI